MSWFGMERLRSRGEFIRQFGTIQGHQITVNIRKLIRDRLKRGEQSQQVEFLFHRPLSQTIAFLVNDHL